MSTDPQQPERRVPAGYIAAAILILMGLIGLASDLVGGDSQVIVLAVGAAFLVLYAWNRAYGFLVPGAILAGLGAGLLAGQALGADSVLVPTGLGAGFLVIFAVDFLVTGKPHRWWPLIPGTILLGAGTVAGTGAAAVQKEAAIWSLIILVLLGILLLLVQAWRGSARRGQP